MRNSATFATEQLSASVEAWESQAHFASIARTWVPTLCGSLVLSHPIARLALGVLIGACQGQSTEPVKRRLEAPAAHLQLPNRCRPLSAKDKQALQGIPEKVEGYCLDPLIEPRHFGGPGEHSLSAGGEKLLGAGSRAFREYGVKRLSAVHYRAVRTGATVDALVMRFDTVEGSFAWFYRPDLERPGPGPSSTDSKWLFGAKSQTSALRGRWVLQLHYTHERVVSGAETTNIQSSLRDFSRNWVAQLGEPATRPAALLRLPTRAQVPGSASLRLQDALGVEAVGDTAMARYQRDKKHWRALVIVHSSADSAREIMASLRRQRGSKVLRWAPHDAFRYVEPRPGAEPRVQWVIGREANVIYGVGDDPMALRGQLSAQREAQIKMTTRQKLLLLGRNVTEGKKMQLRKKP